MFFVHLIYFAIRFSTSWRPFQWFGPDSLIPSWQDIKDAILAKWEELGVDVRVKAGRIEHREPARPDTRAPVPGRPGTETSSVAGP